MASCNPRPRKIGCRGKKREEWGTVFGDPVVATVILDRLLHRSQVIAIRGDSCRLREKRRAGLIKPATLDQAAA
jgi:hypothetical protein